MLRRRITHVAPAALPTPYNGADRKQLRRLLPPANSEEELWENYAAAEAVPHFGPVAFNKDAFIGQEKRIVKQMTAVSLIGDQAAFKQQLADLESRVAIEEIMVNSFIYDLDAQIHSYELLAQALA